MLLVVVERDGKTAMRGQNNTRGGGGYCGCKLYPCMVVVVVVPKAAGRGGAIGLRHQNTEQPTTE